MATIYTAHDDNDHALRVLVEDGEARLSVDAAGLAAVSIKVTSAQLRDAANAIDFHNDGPEATE